MEEGVRIGLIMKNLMLKKLRDFGILIGFVFPILIGWILPAISGHLFRTWTLWIGIPSIILSMFKPTLLFYPYQLWMSLGHVLGWINSRLILGLVFILILQPIALIMKALGHDPLRTKKSNNNSYREDKRNHKINLKRIF